MTSHKIRLAIIALLTAITLIGVIVLIALEQASGTAFGVVTGVLSTLLPALLDAAAVERRRRDPSIPAPSDDVVTGRGPASPPDRNGPES